MGWQERIPLYKEIEEHRKRPLIVYVTSKRAGVGSQMATDALPALIEQFDALPKGTKRVDFMIVSFGGDPMVAWRIMSLLRQRAVNVSVLIPQSAYSAATLVALGADEIVMHPNGHLGPVDMQITTSGDQGQPRRFSTEDITAFLDFVRDNLKITDQEHVRMLFEVTCREVGSLGIGFTARSSKLAVDLGERLLAMHMKDDESRSKLRSIVENMSRKFQSHAYPVSRTEALDLGLPVNKKRDAKLEDLMWKTWLAIEEALKEREPFDAIIELAKSGEASKLFASIPQLDIPAPAVASSHYSTTIADVQAAATISIDPVDFEVTAALVESSRQANTQVTKGKILAYRAPDLLIQYNLILTGKTWERMTP